jgi:hypothetical protein
VSRQRPGSIQPAFKPGASVFENELHSITLPLRSNAFAGRGVGGSNCSSA